MKTPNLRLQVAEAVYACQEKKAEDITLLRLDPSSSGFTDYFVICTGTNPRQVQAICDEVDLRLGRMGLYPTHIEGYTQAEWVLVDYVDFVIHVFSEKARRFYDLERLWKSAKRLTAEDLKKPARKPARKKAVTRKPARRPKKR